jgi:3-hydroxy-D-aspartate aldolase
MTVRPPLLDDAWLGTAISEQSLAALERLGVDSCGEFGEFHTVVTHCPLFRVSASARTRRTGDERRMPGDRFHAVSCCAALCPALSRRAIETVDQRARLAVQYDRSVVMNHNRRAFLASGAAAATYVWIPKPVKGYTAAEMLAPVKPMSAGISKWDLDTPALCVDLDKLDRNLAKMQKALAANKLDARPHAKTHKCAAIAKLQMKAGAIGICTAKLSEAEALADEGIDRICMTTGNLSANKIRRAMKLRKRLPNFIQAVDYEPNARELSDAAKEAGVTADVVIDVAVGTRSGIPAGEGALSLAKLIDTLPNLKLRGLLSYDGGAQHITGFAARKERTLKNIEENARTFEAMKKAGLNTGIFSGGGTGTYNIQHLVPGFTDVQVGSYIFMDMQYLAIGSDDGDPVYKDFEPSLTVLTTILNNRFPGRLTTDAGAKALTLNTPRAGVIGEPGMDYNAGSDEFGSITFKESSKTYRMGDRLEVIVPHCDPVVNEYDYIYGTRKDRVEVVWPITARGHSQ